MNRVRTFFVLSAALALSLSLTTGAQAAGLQAAVARAQQTGLPMFVIGTSESCGFCKQLKQRLSSEAELQPLIAQYVPLELNVEDPEFRTWTGKYKPTDNGLPMIFIVSSDGTQLYNASGSPQGDGLKRLLMQGIQQTGGFKDLNALAQDIGKMNQAIARAKVQLERGSRDDALRTLYPYLKDWDTLQESPSPAAKELVALLQPLVAEGDAKLEEATGQLAEENRQLVGLVSLLAVKRSYGGFPPIGEKVEAKLTSISEDESLAALLPQAELIDRARALDESNATTAAIAAYGRVVERFPNTQAAQLSQIRANQLAAQQQTSSTSTAGAELSEEERVKRAQSYLKMAATFSSTRPEKAKEYYQQALKIAPPTSAEAYYARQGLGQ